jgi:ribosomal protein S18 acetylase RimI-like enzyme
MCVRLLTSADLAAAMALKESAGWNQTEADWRLLLEQEPEGCFAIESEGRVVASATAYCYGRDLAWIGMVLTLPQARRRGFGWRAFCAAVDFCQDRGVRCLKLDATDMGRPLYERAQFLPEYQVERWAGGNCGVRTAECGVNAGTPHSALRIPHLTEERLRALGEMDAVAFGVSRDSLLRALLRNCDWSACLERNGGPVAYLMSRPGANARYFGPCVAATAEDARALFEAFFACFANQPIFVDVPAPNRAARGLLQSFGFQVRRTLLRMYRGPNDQPGDPSLVFGLAGFEYG